MRAPSALLCPQEAESRPRCRRLQLKDMIPTEMQRLTKYPLLLQSIGQNTGASGRGPHHGAPASCLSPWRWGQELPGLGFTGTGLSFATEEPVERERVELAAECCREILHHVNQAVRDMEDLLVSLALAMARDPGRWGVRVRGWGGPLSCLPWGPFSGGRAPLSACAPQGLWGSASPWVVPVTLPSPLQRLKDYQKRLDLSHLRQSNDPMLSEFKVALPALTSPSLPGLPLPTPSPDPPAPGIL